jgi:cell wall-associated NlpC family hydrolase
MCPAVGAAVVAAIVPIRTSAAQQSGVSLSPFITFLPTGGANPMAGLAIAVSGGPLALRASGHLSFEERSATATTDVTTRPWGADADAIAYLESYGYRDRIAFTPYVFAGLSTALVDSGPYRMNRQGWSYGGGLTVPVGRALGLFGEIRWRMSQYVLPDAVNAPPATHEFRVGLSFRVGGGGTIAELVREVAAAEADGAIIWDGSGREAPNGRVARVLSAAAGYVGTPYRRGGISPSSGFDAAGFVRFVFARFGVILPRSSRDQARVGDRIRADWRVIEPGDLVMFEDEGGISHVAIYVGRARIIHSSETGGGVRYDDLTTERGQWFYHHLAAARRVSPDTRGMLLDLTRGFPTDGQDGWDDSDHAPRAQSRRRN